MAYRPMDYNIPIKITKKWPGGGLSIRPTSVRKLASSNNSKRNSNYSSNRSSVDNLVN